MQTKKDTKIAFIGKFVNLNDEEYIARSFEMIGCKVLRIPQHTRPFDIKEVLIPFKPDIIIYAKWECPLELVPVLENLRKNGAKTVCWLFDLYFNYERERLVKSRSFFRSDVVFTTDGGHQKQFADLGINHHCVRQGIYKPECVLYDFDPIEHEIVFVGSDSPIFPSRGALMRELKVDWFGRRNTNELRGTALNELYAKSRIVLGDSYPSPHYWSNRVVETLGRGGFLIHKETAGLSEAYPHLITYTDKKDLKEKIKYYATHENERQAVIIKNFNWVRDHYTMEKQCRKVLDILNE